MVIHFGVFLTSLLLLNQIWMIILVLVTVLGSFYYSRNQYQAITNSSDDLCWSGECWLMHSGSQSNGIDYIDLLPTSWITPHFCLLKFERSEQEVAWLFSRSGLGDRLYRELCYLSCLDMNNSK